MDHDSAALPEEVLRRVAPDQQRQILGLRAMLGPRGFHGIPDLATRRARFEEVATLAAAKAPGAEEVLRRDLSLPGLDGAPLQARLYRPAAVEDVLPAILYLHGGGGVMGSVQADEPTAARLCALSGACLLSLGYCLAPESKGDRPAHEALAALRWLAGAEGIDPARIALAGASAGGGIAACAALLARGQEELPPLSLLLLLYPMLDDRTAFPNGAPELGVWDAEANAEAWALRRGNAAGEGFAAARAESLAGLPPVYMDVGDLDLFLPENLAFAARLAEAAVPVECHVHPGSCHGFDQLAPRSAAATSAQTARASALRRALFPLGAYQQETSR